MNSSDIKERGELRSRSKIRDIMIASGVPEENIEKEIDKIYTLADIFVDHWISSVQKNHEPANKKECSNILQS